ncbi:MAG: endonuclease/exonuclease/phosphatase family protein [Acidimicrobiales bacterium]
MRPATFNILHGRSPTDGLVSTSRLVEACASLHADILCLQEVDRAQRRSGFVDQVSAVAEGMGAAWWRFEPALVGEPGAVWRPAVEGDSADSESPGYGVGIVSRLPVRKWHVLRLPASRVRSPVAVPGGKGRFILLPDEPRVVLAAEVDGPSGRLTIATTHLSFVPGWNVVQLRRATRALAATSAACILTGDLNLPGPIPRIASGWLPLATARTFPVGRPSMQIDHVLGHGNLPRVVATAVEQLPLSDHLALVVDLGDG